MCVTLTQTQLIEMLKGFNKVIAKAKSGLPILRNVLFSLNDNGFVQATVSNLEETLCYNLPAEALVSEEGFAPFLISIEELSELRKGGKRSNVITIEVDSNNSLKIKILSDKQIFEQTVKTVATDDFPETLKNVPMKAFSLKSFFDAFRCAAPFSSTESTRFALTGVYLGAAAKLAVATDGHRLTMTPIPGYPLEYDAIVPTNQVLTKFFPETETGSIGILHTDDAFVFAIEADRWFYQCKCIDAVFPNYKQVIPDYTQPGRGSLTFDKDDIATLEEASKHTSNQSDNQLFVYAANGGVYIGTGEQDYNLSICQLSQTKTDAREPFLAVVNGKSLVQALKHNFLTAKDLGSGLPVYFEGEGENMHLLMPFNGIPNERVIKQFERFIDKESSDQKEGQAMAVAETQEKESGGTIQQFNNTENEATQQEDKETVPQEELLNLVSETLEVTRQATTLLKEVKKQAKSLERHYKSKEKIIQTKEKEFQKNKELISKLQEAVNF